MNHGCGKTISCIAMIVWLCAIAASSAPIKVYILAGQSNMEGCGNVDEFKKLTSEQQTYTNVELYYSLKGSTSYEHKEGLTPGTYGDVRNFGPEVGIAKVLSQRYNNEKMIFIKIAWGGTVLQTNWLGNKPYSYTYPGNDFDKVYSWFTSCLDAIMPKIAQSTIAYGYKIQGFYWMQGEGDAAVISYELCHCQDNDEDTKLRSQKYAANLTAFVNNVRTYIDSKKWNTNKIYLNSISALPFVYGKIRNISPADKNGPSWKYGNIVQYQQTKAQTLIPCVRCAEGSAHAEVYTKVPPPPDHLEYNPAHYTTTGILTVGKVLGTAMLQLCDGVSTPGCWNPKDGEESILFSD
jgi:hypothetical protein